MYVFIILEVGGLEWKFLWAAGDKTESLVKERNIFAKITRISQFQIYCSFISDTFSVNFGIDFTATHTNTKIEYTPSALPDFLVKNPILALQKKPTIWVDFSFTKLDSKKNNRELSDQSSAVYSCLSDSLSSASFVSQVCKDTVS